MTVESRYRVVGEDRFSTVLRQIDANSNKLEKTMLRLGGVIAGAFSAGAIGGAIQRQVDFGNQIANLSVRLDASTEALSEYEHVAKRTGVTFNTLTTALQRQRRRVAEAAQGTGEAKNALIELGIAAETFTRLRPEQQFERLADAFANVGNQGDRVRLAMRLWDTEGVALLQTVEGGSRAIRGYRKEAERLGLTLDKEAVGNLLKTQEAFDMLTGRIDGLARRLTVAMAPAIVLAVDLTEVWLNTLGKLFDQYSILFKALKEGLTGNFEEAKRSLDSMTPTLVIFEESLRNIGAAWDRMGRQSAAQNKALDDANNNLGEQVIKLPRVEREQNKVNRAVERHTEAIKADTAESYEWITAQGRAESALQRRNTSLRGSISSFQTLMDRQREARNGGSSGGGGQFLSPVGGIQIQTNPDGRPVEGTHMLGFTFRNGQWRRDAPQIGLGGFTTGFATGGVVPANGVYRLEAGERVVSNNTHVGAINVHMHSAGLGVADGRRFVREVVIPELRAAQR